MIYLTGDTHIPIDIEKLNTKNFPKQKKLSRDDYVIVLGDFGLLWKKNKTYEYWKKWLEEKNFTTLWIDGNHENHAWVNSLPIESWNGGFIHRISENIIHLMRGQVFEIHGKTFFTCGGAASYDKAYRTEGISWWPEENIIYQECETAIDNLQKYNNTVDYILTHTCPQSLVIPMFNLSPITCPTGIFLDEVYKTVKFKDWYFGHWHEDKDFGNFHCLYDNIIRLL